MPAVLSIIYYEYYILYDVAVAPDIEEEVALADTRAVGWLLMGNRTRPNKSLRIRMRLTVLRLP